MVIKKWEALRKWKTYKPSNYTTSRLFSELLQILTWKSKNALKLEFSRKKIRLSNIEDVANYIKNLYNKQ